MDWITVLHIFEIIIHIVSISINFVLNIIIQSDSSFHAHMGLIIQHICTAFLFSSIYGLFRSFLAIVDWQSLVDIYRTSSSRMTDLQDYSCVLNTAVPSFLCMMFCILPLLLIIERLYATQNCRSYEYVNWHQFLSRFCYALWAPLPILILSNFSSSLRASHEFHMCEMRELTRTPLQRNAWLFIVAFFNLTIAIIFRWLYQKNRAYEIDYLKHHYSTLSIRFQMKENLSTSNFLSKCILLTALFFMAPILLDVYLRDSNYSFYDKIIKRKFWYLSIAFLSMIFPIYFLRHNKKIYCKFTKWWQPKKCKDSESPYVV